MKSSFNLALGDAGVMRARAISIYLILLAGNALAWLWAWTLFSDQPALFGAAVLAYVLGFRHAVDIDHLAAIDNVVRKLVQEGQKPLCTGLFFSLGHSTVVLLAVVAVATMATALQDQFETFKAVGGAIGKIVSAALLLAIGLANLIVLRQIWKSLQRTGGEPRSHADMAGLSGGILARLCAPIFRTIHNSWRMFPLGFLFGLSFDTSTEVSVLGISASQSGGPHLIWSILVFPALFAAGLTLVDTTDGILMVRAYGWALVDPMRKLWYNFTMTFASIAMALFIGSIQIIGLLVEKIGLEGRFWRAIAGLGGDFTTFGFLVVGVFAAAWLLSAFVYRRQRFGMAVANAATD
jgi:nickel/cobalt transporter (NiCoT) family protein